jgi:hypothetical protein
MTQCARFDSTDETPSVAPPAIPTIAAATAIRATETPVKLDGVDVAITEDDRGLGYPDQRKIVSDSKGRLYVVFRRQFRVDGSLQHHIFVARSVDDGKSWQLVNNAEPVERTGNFTQRVPAIAISSDDSLHVIWYGTDAENPGANQRQIKYVRSVDGGDSWTEWRNIAPVLGYAEPQRLWQEHPSIHAQGKRIFVVWQGRDAEVQNRSQVRITNSEDGGETWSVPRVVMPADAGGRSRPLVLASADGRSIYVLAYGDADGHQSIWFTRSADGGETWMPWTLIDRNGKDQRHVTGALDRDGRLHAAWREGGDGVRAFIRYALYENGRWSPPVAVSADGDRFQFFPSISVSLDGRVVLAWVETASLSGFPEEEFRAGTVRWASTRPQAPRWTQPADLSADQPVNFVSLSPHAQQENRIDVVWSMPAGDRQTRIRYSALWVR